MTEKETVLFDKEYSQEHFVHLSEAILINFTADLDKGIDKKKIRDYAQAYCMVQREIGIRNFPAEQASGFPLMPKEVRWNTAINSAHHGKWDLMKEEIQKEADVLLDTAASANEVESAYALEILSKLI